MPRKLIKLAPPPSEAGNSSTTIGFRLDAEAIAVLEQRAALCNESIHGHARTLVLQALTKEGDGAVLQQGLLQLNHEVRHMRADIVFIFQNLLITVGKLSEAEATAWIKRNFKS